MDSHVASLESLGADENAIEVDLTRQSDEMAAEVIRAGLDGLITEMDKLNLRVMISADNSIGPAVTTRVDAVKNSPYQDRVRVLAGVNFNNVGPGWAEKAIAQLETDVKNGAIVYRAASVGVKP